MRTCTITGCGREYRAKGLCTTHWQRAAGYIKKPLVARIDGSPGQTWAREVAAVYMGDECLETPFSVGMNGYSAVGGKQTTPHFVCRIVHGEPPTPAYETCHSCGNRKCCAPKHLRWGTRRDNVQDTIAHGTFSYPPGRL